MKLTCTRPPAHRKILSIVQNRLSHHLKCPKIKKIIMFRKDKDRRSPKFDLTLKRPRLADWHEFARLTQGNSLASVLPSAFWAQDSGFNHSDDMQGSGQTCTTHKHQQQVSEKAHNKQ